MDDEQLEQNILRLLARAILKKAPEVIDEPEPIKGVRHGKWSGYDAVEVDGVTYVASKVVEGLMAQATEAAKVTNTTITMWGNIKITTLWDGDKGTPYVLLSDYEALLHKPRDSSEDSESKYLLHPEDFLEESDESEESDLTESGDSRLDESDGTDTSDEMPDLEEVTE